MHSKFKCSSYKKGRRAKSNTMAPKFSDDYTKSSLGGSRDTRYKALFIGLRNPLQYVSFTEKRKKHWVHYPKGN